MKKVIAKCTSSSGMSTKFSFYIGHPKEGIHPIRNQMAWLSKNGMYPVQSFVDGVEKIYEKASKIGANPEELFVNVIEKIKQIKTAETAADKVPPKKPSDIKINNNSAEEPIIDEDQK